MAEYKDILIGYVNQRKNGEGHYLTITNVSNEPVIIEPGSKIFLNRTPDERLARYPRIPHYSQSIKIEDQQTQEFDSEEVANDVFKALDGDEVPF